MASSVIRPRSERDFSRAQMRRQQHQCRGGDAIDAARLADGLRTRSRELLARFVGKAGDGGIVEIIREHHGLIAPERRQIGRLSLQIDAIFRVRLDLLDDIGTEIGDGRTDIGDVAAGRCWGRTAIQTPSAVGRRD